MISDIFIMCFTLQRNYYGENPLNEELVKYFPKYVAQHLPEGASFKSIEYSKDQLISTFMEKIVEEWIMDIETMIKKGIEIEIGVYKIQLEGDQDYSRCQIPGIEYAFKEMHRNFSFIGSIFLYLVEDELKLNVRLHTFESDDEDSDGFDLEYINEYSDLFYHYFYKGEVPDYWSGEAALMLLTENKI
ncbi:MAG: hypothetical protein PQJ35_00715 [Sphaerochaetaceae bacterium]|nr:hypothetical protein [Sphaerochaetaceae bacterium]